MRILFLGTGAFAVPSLEHLARAGHEITMCVTQPDRPQGRGLQSEPSPVKRAAERLKLPLLQPERLDPLSLQGVSAEAGVALDYGRLIPAAVLTLPRHGMLGVHPSLLPKYRGAAPVAQAILNGDTSTGVTIFRLNERLDAGEVLLRHPVAIEAGENAQALTERLAQIGAEALLRALDLLDRGQARFEAQDEAAASLAPKLTKAQGRIEWTEPAERLERLVRAMAPWPGACTQWQGTALKLWDVSAVLGGSRDVAPGTIVQSSPEALTVATGQGALAVRVVQLAGKRRMSAKEFLAGHRVQPGERLG